MVLPTDFVVAIVRSESLLFVRQRVVPPKYNVRRKQPVHETRPLLPQLLGLVPREPPPPPPVYYFKRKADEMAADDFAAEVEMVENKRLRC